MKYSIKDYVGILLASCSGLAFLLYVIYQIYSQNLPVGTYLFSGGLEWSQYRNNPPTDPFTKQPVLFSASAERFTAYCVGPDNSDGGGKPEYDPTNGIVSAGDITMTLPSKPEFQIPKEGVRAANAEDLRKQFPNGLPRDLFNHAGEGTLSISDTDVPYIYSYGPDNKDSWVTGKDEKGRPIYRKDPILYDPTNGTTSEGDIVAAIPAP